VAAPGGRQAWDSPEQVLEDDTGGAEEGRGQALERGNGHGCHFAHACKPKRPKLALVAPGDEGREVVRRDADGVRMA